MKEEIQKALEVLRKGGVILYPTDTVWGIGCDATDPEAVAKVYAIKKREDSKSLVLLASDLDMICRYVKEVPEMAVQLVEVVVSARVKTFYFLINLGFCRQKKRRGRNSV